MTTRRFKKRPVTVETVCWTGENINEIEAFILGGGGTCSYVDGELIIQTLEGPHDALVGDWIIKGIAGEFYPCKPEIFKATYEEVL